MSNLQINQFPAASSFDGTNDLLLMWKNSDGTTRNVTRNVFLGVTGTPADISSVQTFTNKTLTSPVISNGTLSGTVTGTYTLGGTPTFPSTVVLTTGTQTLSGKTLTSPTINSPTITNANITADAIVGYTTANSGTFYGVAVSSANINGSYLTSGSVTGTQLASSTVALSNIASGVLATSNFSNPYKFSGYMNANQALTATTDTIVNINTVEFDTGNNFNTTTHKYTAPVAGYYRISGAAQLLSQAGSPFFVDVGKNSTVNYRRFAESPNTTGNITLGGSMLLQLAASDQVYLTVYSGQALTLAGSIEVTWLNVELVYAT
jgi:hypothetical protein